MIAAAKLIVAIFFGITVLRGVVHGEDFYKEKTIKCIVGYSPGGLFDTFTRVIARHFGKHLAGKPNIVVDNMTGAGGIILGNHLYHQAKPDGLTIGAWGTPLVLQQILGTRHKL